MASGNPGFEAALQGFCDWLAATSTSQLFADLSWFVPIVQTVHILAIAVVVTSLSLLNFRLLGLTRKGPGVQNLVQGFLPWVWRAVALLLVSGILLTITEPTRELMNTVFRIKMLLVLILVAVTFIVQSALRRSPDYWSSTPQRQLLGSTLAVASLFLCVSIVAAGRLIAYV